MQICDAGPAIVKAIISELDDGHRILPTQFSLKDLEKSTHVRAQTIGMAFDTFIKPALFAKGISANKCGAKGRMIIQLVRI